jgi:Concanavalin A-like lectin/glucanases superfamily
VKPGRRIRWTYTYNSVVYTRYDGHVGAWPTAWIADGRSAVADITATDRLKFLARPTGRDRSGELRSMLTEETLRDAPVIYYQLDEESGATSAGSVGTGQAAGASVEQVYDSTGGEVTFGSGTGPGFDQQSAAVFTPAELSGGGPSQTNGRYLRAYPAKVATGGVAASLECWFATSVTPTPDPMGLCALTSRGSAGLLLAIGTNGRVRMVYSSFGEDLFANSSPNAYADGHTHHAVVTLAKSGSTMTARLYVDGTQVQSGTFTLDAPLPTFVRVDLGGTHVGGYTAPFAGTLSHVAGYATTLSAARVLVHYQAGSTGLAGERTDQRINRIADWIGLPAADRALDVGDKLVGAQATSGKPPLEVMREAAAAEQGVLYVGRTGLLTFHRRGRRYNPVPAVTLDAAGGRIQLGSEWSGDDFGVVNDATVSRAGGASQRVINTASMDEYGPYRDPDVELPTFSDDDAWAVASWRVNANGDPKNRIANLTVSLSRLDRQSPAQVAQLLNLDISDVIRLINLPAQAPAPTMDLFVEGWTEHLDRKTGEWTITFNTSPADATVAQVWAFGVTGYSEFGVSTRLAL